MYVDASAEARGPGAAATWASGMVAQMLGVSPVTLRSWSSRYGIGPSLRESGKHRRYSDLDVRRLQHMQRLIDRGLRPREAAAKAFADSDDAQLTGSAPQSVRQLGEAADGLQFANMGALLDETLSALGPAVTWSEVVAPVLEHLGGRWLRGQACFESEWALTNEVSAALQRFSARYESLLPGRPVLLACCPGERHCLPMEFLRVALVEAGIPAVFLGQMVPAETTAGMASKLDPPVVMLWSMSVNTADDLLAHRIAHSGVEVCAAGPGWERFSTRSVRKVNDMAAALEFVSASTRV
ncbi:MerR family transcriptional regulator [Amycolatopsis sp. NPDC004378]